MSWVEVAALTYAGTAVLAVGVVFWEILRDSARRRAGLTPEPVLSADAFATSMLLLLWPLLPLALLFWGASVLLSKHYARRAS